MKVTQKHRIYVVTILFFASFLSPSISLCQGKNSQLTKNSMYFYWGYNRSAYTKSSLRCIGQGYDFTMNKLTAHDNPERFDPRVYFNPKKITIPQFNVRLGCFIRDNWSLSFGYDHMKYVMDNNQLVDLHGHIDEGISDEWSGDYFGETVRTNSKYIHYENSDGLNYIRVELSNYRQLFSFGQNDWLKVNSHMGLSLGTILSFNDFNFGNQFDRKTVSISGYGISLSGGLRVDLFQHFFVQTNLVGGLIQQLKVRTRPKDKMSYAKQIFGYGATETVIGFSWKI